MVNLILLIGHASSLLPAAPVRNITFDDIGIDVGGWAPVPEGYAGFNWQNIFVLRGKEFCADSGFEAGTISEPNALYNGMGEDASMSVAQDGTTFTLHSFSATGAFRDNLKVTLTARKSNGESASVAYTVLRLEVLNVDLTGNTAFTDLTEVSFATSEGEVAGVCGVDRREVVMDNLVVSFP
jgi:hypothetical protein